MLPQAPCRLHMMVEAFGSFPPSPLRYGLPVTVIFLREARQAPALVPSMAGALAPP